METVNATIASATMSSADHGMLVLSLSLEFDGYTQALGGYGLYAPKGFSKADHRSLVGFWVWRLMETVGVSEWGSLAGKVVRVRHGDDGLVEAIGHIVKDKWFCPGKEIRALEGSDE